MIENMLDLFPNYEVTLDMIVEALKISQNWEKNQEILPSFSGFSPDFLLLVFQIKTLHHMWAIEKNWLQKSYQKVSILTKM